MGPAQRGCRRWRTSKSKRRTCRAGKRSAAWRPQMMNGDESVEPEEIDRLLLSSLRLWEVERDLIEERMAAKGR